MATHPTIPNPDFSFSVEPSLPLSLKGFWKLFFVQMQGAFSDNFFKFLVILFAGRGVSTEVRDDRLFLILAVFTLPFILFSMAAGGLADRFAKGRVITWTKLLEIAVMLIGTLALASQSFPFMLGVIFLMSVQSTIFSPAKYSSLPELLPETRLSWGNGLIGAGTFVAIIAGGVLGGFASDKLGNAELWKAGLLPIGLAIVGTALSFGIPRIAAADPDKRFRINFLGELGNNLNRIRPSRVLSLSIAGSVYFWLVAALFEPTLVVYGQDLLQLDDDANSLLRAFLAVGLGLGFALAGFLSGRKIEYGLVPLGAFGLAVTSLLLAIPGLSFVPVCVILTFLGISGGFFVVPVNALLQHLPERKDKGSVLAANGLLTSLAALLAAILFLVLKRTIGVEANVILFLIGTVTIGATVYAMTLVPDSLARLLLWGLSHTFYRVRVQGREHLPEKGGALLVSNHLSMVDALFLIASTDRRIRFLMSRDHYNRRWLRPIARMLKVIPIAADLRPNEMLAALGTAREAVLNGEVVCVFAEGAVSRTGQTLPFRKGMERIMKDVEAPILPVSLDNVWGSIFSFDEGKFYWKMPRQIPYPITVSYGEPMAPDSAPQAVRSQVVALGAEAWETRKDRIPTVGAAFVRTARRARRRFAFADSSGAKMHFTEALTRTLFLTRRLRKTWAGQRNVGILLPPSAGGALVNLAGMLMGKSVVNLNYTLSEESLRSCIAQCGITCVVTSKKVIDKLGLDLGVPCVLVEEIASKPHFFEKLSAAAMALLCPRRLLLRWAADGRPPGNEDNATIIFSSGSTGEPKGAMLSHYNVVSNMLQLSQAFNLKRDDRFLGVLPFFHSLGFTATLIGPAVVGAGAAYHPVPTDARTVGKLVAGHQLSLLLATPTFLQLYLRGCTPEQFQSLHLVVVGAEKMPPRLATAFAEKFGILPLEAYGCTECSPGVAANTPDFLSSDLRQTGNRPETIGRPLPGLSVKILDPETGAPCPTGQPGLMWVKGPNVMRGYLDKPELTAEVLVDGWYNTGDITAQDEDGFLTITDRLSRFSKIGGEMVPHIKVEGILHEIADLTEQSFVVAGLPDEKKGERLVVLHTLAAEALATVLQKLAASSIPNLWKPRADQFFEVAAFPYLGSGKLDLKGIKLIAAERAG
jgi:acyl-[acyl-carrier-protein]-phospholipid O-acyltransferase/long-chain-fatty-acid--[acyl-carrier-protein] ligase